MGNIANTNTEIKETHILIWHMVFCIILNRIQAMSKAWAAQYVYEAVTQLKLFTDSWCCKHINNIVICTEHKEPTIIPQFIWKYGRGNKLWFSLPFVGENSDKRLFSFPSGQLHGFICFNKRWASRQVADDFTPPPPPRSSLLSYCNFEMICEFNDANELFRNISMVMNAVYGAFYMFRLISFPE